MSINLSDDNGAVIESFSKANHGLVAGNLIKGESDQYEKFGYSDNPHSLYGIVLSVDADNVIYSGIGRINDFSGFVPTGNGVISIKENTPIGEFLTELPDKESLVVGYYDSSGMGIISTKVGMLEEEEVKSFFHIKNQGGFEDVVGQGEALTLRFDGDDAVIHSKTESGNDNDLRIQARELLINGVAKYSSDLNISTEPLSFAHRGIVDPLSEKLDNFDISGNLLTINKTVNISNSEHEDNSNGLYSSTISNTSDGDVVTLAFKTSDGTQDKIGGIRHKNGKLELHDDLTLDPPNPVFVSDLDFDGLSIGKINGAYRSIEITSKPSSTYIGSGAIAIGYKAGFSNTSGRNWIAQGFFAGTSNTKGSYWIAQGDKAGWSNVDGLSWIAQGNKAGYSNISGSNWIAQGSQAGGSNTTGSNWIASGYGAGGSNTTGSNWIASGYGAGRSNTTGSNWIAQGSNSGHSNLIGSNWVAQGAYAGYSIKNDSYWVAQGAYAGYSIENGSHWVAVGSLAGHYNKNGSNWVAVGAEAGNRTSTGKLESANKTIHIGYNSKSLEDNAENEIVIGSDAVGNGSNTTTIGNEATTKCVLHGATEINGISIGKINGTAASIQISDTPNTSYTGSNGQIIGYKAGFNNTTGRDWIAQGVYAGTSSTTGSSWIAQGFAAGMTNVDGWGWIAQGKSAGYNNKSGSLWVAQGYEAGHKNVSGSNWIAQGSYAGRSNTTGSEWVAQGRSAGASNVDGYRWISIGAYSGSANVSGSYWVAQGYRSGYYNKDGSNWIAIGAEAGKHTSTGDLTSANKTIHIGYNSKSLEDNALNEIVIGSDAVGNGNNSVTIGNDDITKTVLKGNVGVGTNTPEDRLHVNGGAIVNGFTKLGDDAPAIKHKKLTGTTPNSVATLFGVTHGLDSNKILSVSVHVSHETDKWMGKSYPAIAFEFGYYVGITDIFIRIGDNATSILSKPVKILVTYEE